MRETPQKARERRVNAGHAGGALAQTAPPMFVCSKPQLSKLVIHANNRFDNNVIRDI